MLINISLYSFIRIGDAGKDEPDLKYEYFYFILLFSKHFTNITIFYLVSMTARMNWT